MTEEEDEADEELPRFLIFPGIMSIFVVLLCFSICVLVLKLMLLDLMKHNESDYVMGYGSLDEMNWGIQ